MRPAATGSPPTKDNPRGQAGTVGKASYIGQSNHSATLSQVKRSIGNVLPFLRQRRTCSGCGIGLAFGNTCAKCQAWDGILRALSLRRQALGELARAGGV